MIEILYRDIHIVVCLKPIGVNSQDDGENSMPQMLARQLEVNTVYPVHRLDKAVGGVMVYALTQKAAADLSRQVQDRTMEKQYLAVLCGKPQEEQAVLQDLLFHDKMKNKTYVVTKMRKGVKPAALDYRVLEYARERTLVRVRLHTGRTHQIRVQFASRKLPLAADRRYGGRTDEKQLGLWSCELRFVHPQTGEKLVFTQLPPKTAPWDAFSYISSERE